MYIISYFSSNFDSCMKFKPYFFFFVNLYNPLTNVLAVIRRLLTSNLTHIRLHACVDDTHKQRHEINEITRGVLEKCLFISLEIAFRFTVL